MKKIQAIVVLVCSLLVGCGGKGPQRPTYKSGQAPQEDTAAIALMEMNRRMAKEADQALLRYVEGQEEQYALMAISNAWMRIAGHGDSDGPSPKEDELWCMHIRTKDTEGRLLFGRGARISHRTERTAYMRRHTLRRMAPRRPYHPACPMVFRLRNARQRSHTSLY